MSRGPDVQPLIDYFAREGYYRHVQTICKEVLMKRANRGKPASQKEAASQRVPAVTNCVQIAFHTVL